MLVAATRQVHGPESMGIVAATGCNTVLGSTYPYIPYLVPWTNSLFENGPADAMGIRARWDQAGHPDRRLWVIGGDGAMYVSAAPSTQATRLDLGAAEVSSAPLSLTLNASSATLLLSVGGDAVPSDVTLNASSLTICAAPAFGLRIASDNTQSSDNFNGVGLERVGDGWPTLGYDTSATRMQLAISANVSSTTLDLTGACP